MKKEKKEFKKNKKLKTFLTIFCLTTLFLSSYYLSTVVFAWVGPKKNPPTGNRTFGDFCQKIYGGCSTSRCLSPCATVAVGGACGGGKVAYHDGSGGGFIFHSTDNNGGNTIQWGCRGQGVGTTSEELGTGLANTNTIVAFHNNTANFGGNDYYSFGGGYSTIGCIASNNGTVAAKVCKDLNSGGYTDWYLPSWLELEKLYINRAVIGGITSDYYWSSSESSTTTAACINPTDGNGESSTSVKSNSFRVRCIRAF